jgi:hypothetical protein
MHQSQAVMSSDVLLYHFIAPLTKVASLMAWQKGEDSLDNFQAFSKPYG